MEDSEKQQAIEQFRNSTIAMFEKLKGVDFELMKAGVSKNCMTNLSIVKNIVDADVVIVEDGTTLEYIINDGNNEIQKIVDSVVITDEELEEVKKSLLDKVNFEMSKGEFILYQKISEIMTAYFSINKIANSTKNLLLEAIPHLINQDKK